MQRLLEVFTELDVDKSGRVDIQELRHGLLVAKIIKSKKDAADLMSKVRAKLPNCTYSVRASLACFEAHIGGFRPGGHQ